MSHFHYPVVRVYPTHTEVVSEHLTRADAETAAARLDFLGEQVGVYHLAGEPCCQPDHARAH